MAQYTIKVFLSCGITLFICACITQAKDVCSVNGTVYDCSSKNLTAIPADELPPELTSLDLSNNLFTELTTDAFSKFINMETLTLENNKINKIDETAFDKTVKLVSLTLAGNAMSSVPDTLPVSLTTLELSNNEFSAIPGLALAPLTNLKSLDLSSNNIQSIPAETFNTLAKLTVLSLAANDVISMDVKAFTGLVILEELDISNNKLPTIPNALFEPCGTTITKITMTDSSVGDIEKSFANLPKLTNLDLSNNVNLTITDKTAFEDDVLDTLNLHGFGFSLEGNNYHLPEAVRSLKLLKTLHVARSRFSTFSDEDLTFFDKLTTLKAMTNPYSCVCRNSAFISWFKGNPKAIPDADVDGYSCATCDECTELPTKLKSFDMDHCEPPPTLPPTPKPKECKSVSKYVAGMLFLGLAIGIMLTSCGVFYMMRSKRACFRNTYSDLDRSI